MFTRKMTTSVIKKFGIIILYYPGRCNIITRILREREGVEVRVGDVITEAKVRERERKEVHRCCAVDAGEKWH